MTEPTPDSPPEDILFRLDRERREGVASGERCSRCGGWIFCVKPPGHPRECIDCYAIANSSDEVSSSKYIRCPKCGGSWDPYEAEQYDVFNEDVHAVSCVECDHGFEVTTTVTYSFESPARLAEELEEEEADENLDDEEDE